MTGLLIRGWELANVAASRRSLSFLAAVPRSVVGILENGISSESSAIKIG